MKTVAFLLTNLAFTHVAIASDHNILPGKVCYNATSNKFEECDIPDVDNPGVQDNIDDWQNNEVILEPAQLPGVNNFPSGSQVNEENVAIAPEPAVLDNSSVHGSENGVGGGDSPVDSAAVGVESDTSMLQQQQQQQQQPTEAEMFLDMYAQVYAMTLDPEEKRQWEQAWLGYSYEEKEMEMKKLLTQGLLPSYLENFVASGVYNIPYRNNNIVPNNIVPLRGFNSGSMYKPYMFDTLRTLSKYNSDKRLKKDIKPIENALDTIQKLQGVTYNWRVAEFPEENFDDLSHIGFIAQDLEEVLPDTVNTEADGYLTVNYHEFTALLAEGIKELEEERVAFEEETNAEIRTLKILAGSALAVALMFGLVLLISLCCMKGKKRSSVGNSSKENEDVSPLP